MTTHAVAPSAQALLDENERLREALADAKLQIEYLHDKFRTTGSGIAALARIGAALSAFHDAPDPAGDAGMQGVQERYRR